MDTGVNCLFLLGNACVAWIANTVNSVVERRVAENRITDREKESEVSKHGHTA